MVAEDSETQLLRQVVVCEMGEGPQGADLVACGAVGVRESAVYPNPPVLFTRGTRGFRAQVVLEHSVLLLKTSSRSYNFL